MKDLLRSLPKVDRVTDDAGLARWPRGVVVGAARQILEQLRSEILAGAIEELPDIVAQIDERCRWLAHGRLVRVINATGVVVHTNLGRAPWSAGARAAAERVARYCDLEVDLQSGQRGGRLRGVRAQLRHLVGAPSTLVVNNNAAAVLLALTALADGQEVVVSRGELVEIGGAFRVPDVIASGGAHLVEVGTTNRTRIADYERAIGPRTAILLKVHPSNFRISGFTDAPSRAELVELGRRRGVLVVEDLGSGALRATADEPSVADVVASGLDLVCFSGDKLLGGPQSGVIVGREDLVERLEKHPLYRALRVDKVILAALEGTLGDHAAGQVVPVDHALGEAVESVRARAGRVAEGLREAGVPCVIAEVASVAGGGALPGEVLPSVAVQLVRSDAEGCARALRAVDPAVHSRVHGGAVVLDLRTVHDDEVDELIARVAVVTRGR